MILVCIRNTWYVRTLRYTKHDVTVWENERNVRRAVRSLNPVCDHQSCRMAHFYVFTASRVGGKKLDHYLGGIRGKGWEGKMWSERERGGTGTGRNGNRKPCDVSFPTANSRPFPSTVSVPTVYRPVRRLGPVPIVYRRAACSLRDCFPSHSLASCSHPIPSFAHSVSHPAS